MSDTTHPCEIHPWSSVLCPTRAKLERELAEAQCGELAAGIVSAQQRAEKAEALLDSKMKRTVTVHPASIIYSGCSVHVLIEAVLREPDAMPPEPDRPGAVCW